MAYHLSRASGDPTVLLSIVKRHFLAIIHEEGEENNGGTSSNNGTTATGILLNVEDDL